MQKNVLLITTNLFTIFFIAGCGYHMIKPDEKTVYIEPFSNHTLQPEIDLYLLKNLKKTLAQSPGFITVSRRNEADIFVRGKIQEFTRNPEFISESDSIVMASYKVKVSVEITKNGTTQKKDIVQVYFMELSEKLKTDLLLDDITKKISQDIFFHLINSDEK
ncbi:MAG: LPS assembly lipoprotein LptE [bacterium]|nr:LPS assembly lipoprotein LptE [bacterium]